MNYKSVMLIKATVCAVFGVIIISVPGALYGFFGAALTSGGVFAAREYAATLFGNTTLAWFARNAVESPARRAILWALFVYDAIAFVVSLMAVLSGVMNALGWSVVVIYAFFTWAFGNLLENEESLLNRDRA